VCSRFEAGEINSVLGYRSRLWIDRGWAAGRAVNVNSCCGRSSSPDAPGASRFCVWS